MPRKGGAPRVGVGSSSSSSSSNKGSGRRRRRTAQPIPDWIASLDDTTAPAEPRMPRPPVLAEIEEEGASLLGRGSTEDQAQNDHATAHVLIEYWLTAPFRNRSTTIEEKRKALYRVLDRISVLAEVGSGHAALVELSGKVDAALTEYNDGRLSKRSGDVLDGELDEEGIDVTGQLDDRQFEKIKVVIVKHVRAGTSPSDMIPEIVRLFCKNEKARTDGKARALADQLQEAIDQGELSFEGLAVDEEVGAVFDVVDDLDLSYLKLLKGAWKLRKESVS